MGKRITSKLGAPVARSGFEKAFFPGVELGLDGWERAHSQGAGTGAESASGIYYAPKEVNQALQNKGIETFLRDIFKQKADDVTLTLTTDTSPHPRTLRLASIEYRLDAKRGSRSMTILEASIEVSDSRTSPRITCSVTPRGDWEEFLKPLPGGK